ncbi:MAG: tetratricopeptide repeat protein [Bacteroidetes bacterium]|nr:tetratricopeptide repeat protein [Bacteroidota bacterium]
MRNRSRLLLLMMMLCAAVFGQAKADEKAYQQYFDEYMNIRESSPASALNDLFFAQVLAEKMQSANKLGEVFFHKGYVYRRLGIYHLAMKNYINALSVFEKSANNDRHAWVLLEIANLYRDQKNNTKLAIDYYHKAITAFEKLNSDIGVIVARYCLGELFQNVSQYQKALTEFNLAKDLCKKIKNTHHEAICLWYLGHTNILKNDSASARLFFEELLTLSKKNNDIDASARAYKGMAELAELRHQPNDIIIYYLKALERYGVLNDQLNLTETLDKIAASYFQQGASTNAIKYEEEALEKAEKNKLIQLQKQILLQLSAYYEEKGLIVKANKALRTYIDIQSKEESKSAELIQKEYDVDLLKKDQQFKEEKIQKQNVVIVITVVVIVLFVVLLLVILFKNRSLNDAYQHLFKSGIELNKKKQELIEIKSTTKYTGSTLNDEKQIDLMNAFTQLMKDEKLYLENDLNLDNVAKRMNTNRTYLSQVINDQFGSNFSNLINEYRVREAQVILRDPANKIYTIEAIALKVGFNSKSTFNQVFKKITGLTPSVFMDMEESKNEGSDLSI